MGSPEMGMGPGVFRKIGKESPTIDEYEKEKVETTLREMEIIVGAIKTYLEIATFCDEKKKILFRNETQQGVRRIEGLDMSGPNSVFNKLLGNFSRGIAEILDSFNEEEKTELRQRLEAKGLGKMP